MRTRSGSGLCWRREVKGKYGEEGFISEDGAGATLYLTGRWPKVSDEVGVKREVKEEDNESQDEDSDEDEESEEARVRTVVRRARLSVEYS